MPAALIGRDVIMDWIRKHRSAREFTAGTICTALQAKELNVRSSISHTLTHLANEGFLTCTTPGKHRHRSYKMVPTDAIATEISKPPVKQEKPAVPLPVPPMPGLFLRIEKKLDLLLTAWGIQYE